MTLASRIRALMSAIQPTDFATMPPAERRRFADLARYIADMAEPPAAKPKTGVLGELRDGGRVP